MHPLLKKILDPPLGAEDRNFNQSPFIDQSINQLYLCTLGGNRPFPSSKKSHFQNEAKCETFVVKMSFICIIIKNHFHINSFALSLALKESFFGTRKWPIGGFTRKSQ